MKPYRAMFSARFRVLLQYRAAALAGFGTQLFWGLMRVMIFTAFYESSTAVMPMSLEETVVYVWLGQALLLLLPWNWDREVEQLIRSGNVAYELVRPVDLYWLWYCRAVAMRTAPALLRALPMFIVALLFLGLRVPPSLASAGAFGLAIFGSLLLGGAITSLVNVSLFWTITGDGIARLMTALLVVFSGIIVPLPLFPEWLQGIANVLPFRGVIDVPFRLYMGHIEPEHAVGLFLHQLGWTAAFVVAGRFLLRRGLRRVVVQGG
jgi:ABC-2 type transport system permease protein